MSSRKNGFKLLPKQDFATVSFIRNRRSPDDYYLRIDNEPVAVIKRLNEQFEYDVELGTTFPIDSTSAHSAGYFAVKDAAEWFIMYLKEHIATNATPEPFLRDWYEFKDLALLDISALYERFATDRMTGIIESRERELVGKQESLFASA